MLNSLVSEIEKEKIIVIIRDVEREKLLPLVCALYDGGIRFIELPFSQNEDYINYENIKFIKENFGDKLHVGSGTVLTKEQVVLTKKAGGEFVISPDTYCKVIKKTKKLNMLSIPGAFSSTEIANAIRQNADIVKIFPASKLGADYIKSIRVPLKNAKLLVAGGITLDNILDYKNAGACAFGISSGIVNKEMLENNDYNGIRELAKKYVDMVK